MDLLQLVKADIEKVEVISLGEDDNQAYAEIKLKVQQFEKKIKIGFWTCYGVLGDLERDIISEDLIYNLNVNLKNFHECEDELVFID